MQRNQYIASLWTQFVPDVSAEQLDQLADIAADYYHNSFAGVQGRVSFTFKRLGGI